MHLQMARHALNTVAQMTPNDLQVVGIHDQDFQLTTGNVPWVATNKAVVKNTLHILTHSTMDIMGLDNFAPPAEYVAAVIGLFVAPVNQQVACAWIQRPPSGLEMIIDGSPEMQPVSASRLFALVLLLDKNIECRKAAAVFEKRVGQAIIHYRLENGIVNDEG